VNVKQLSAVGMNELKYNPGSGLTDTYSPVVDGW